MNESGLTAAEQAELEDRIAGGDISRSCCRAHIDWFNVALSTGARVAGSYEWDSEDWIDVRVYRKGRRV